MVFHNRSKSNIRMHSNIAGVTVHLIVNIRDGTDHLRREIMEQHWIVSSYFLIGFLVACLFVGWEIAATKGKETKIENIELLIIGLMVFAFWLPFLIGRPIIRLGEKLYQYQTKPSGRDGTD